MVPTTLYVTGPQLANCISWTEFAALTAAQQQNVLLLCLNPGPLLGGSPNTSFLVDGMILAYFFHPGPTLSALTALAQGSVTPRWQTGAGLNGPVLQNDSNAAGLS